MGESESERPIRYALRNWAFVIPCHFAGITSAIGLLVRLRVNGESFWSFEIVWFRAMNFELWCIGLEGLEIVYKNFATMNKFCCLFVYTLHVKYAWSFYYNVCSFMIHSKCQINALTLKAVKRQRL